MKNLKSIFIISILFFLLFINKSHAEVLKSLKVEGNDRITSETIIIFGDIEFGKNYAPSDINSLIKKLFDTRFFSNVSAELKNGELFLKVKENPIINSIVFDGESAKKFKEALLMLLSLREKTSFVENNIKSDINIIKEFYRHLGFYFIKIDLDVEELSKNRVNLIYTLDKGEKAKISKIIFLGDKKIRDKRLRDVITSQESKFWKFLSKNVYLSKKRIALDKRLLKNYYKNKGYYEIEISSSNVEYSEGEGFVLSYSVNAGPRYKFKKIFANVSEELDKSAFASLEKEFNSVVGEYYSQRRLTGILEKIDTLSDQKELQFINHNISETLSENAVTVQINIFEGKKYTIERVNIVGNNVTNDSVIRGELLVDEGDPYSEILINKSLNKLRSRDIFGKINKKIEDGSLPDLKVLEISVEEKATGEISAGAGFGTDGSAFMFSVRENNWLGRGIKLDSAVNLSEETISGRISVSNPNYNYSGNEVYTALDVASSDKTTSSGYESKKTGYSLGTRFEQYENVYLSPEIRMLYESMEVQDSASASLKKMDGSYTNLDFAYGVTFDKRNQIFNPTKGYKTTFIQSLPILQDSSSILNGFKVSTYRDFSDDVIGALKFQVRAINGIDGDTRLTSRLFIPQKSLRGFRTQRVGPKDGADWIGGNYMSTLNFESRLPNILPEETRTDISLFLDTANVWGVDYDSSVAETSEIRSAVGISADIFTAVGPMSLTFAQSITKADTDETESFNFRLGTSF